MAPTLGIDSITLPAFQSALSRYSKTVPERLNELDELRYTTIPAAIEARRKAAKDSSESLTKDEVEKLVEWKLKHGTYRPKLAALVASNPSSAVAAATSLGISRLRAGTRAPACLSALTALKGIGPATASLLLSVADPAAAPFFSDELFRYAVWDVENGVRNKELGTRHRLQGWGRAIKYNAKEYEALCAKVEAVRERLGVRAVDVERVAYVLGKEEKHLVRDVEDGEEAEVAGDEVVEGDEIEEKGKSEEETSKQEDGGAPERRSKRRAVATQRTELEAEKGRAKRPRKKA